MVGHFPSERRRAISFKKCSNENAVLLENNIMFDMLHSLLNDPQAKGNFILCKFFFELKFDLF